MSDDRGYWVTVPDDFAEGLDVIASLLDFGRYVRHTFQELGDVHPESRAASEIRYAASTFGSPELAIRLHRMVQVWGVACADYLGGVAALCRAREVILSPAPLLRSCMEYAARGIWLLDHDPAVTPTKRMARAILGEILSAEEACKAASHLASKNSQAYKEAKAELDELRTSVAPRLSTDVVLEGPQRAWRIEGEALLSPTDAFRHFEKRWGDARTWEGTYDALSAYSHPGLLILDFFEQDRSGATVLTTTLDTVTRMIRGTVVLYYQFLKHHLAFCGWSSLDFEKWVNVIPNVFPGFFSPDGS